MYQIKLFSTYLVLAIEIKTKFALPFLKTTSILFLYIQYIIVCSLIQSVPEEKCVAYNFK